ncbi:hypothetical protein TNCV_2377251 [Trichonephila clavipes]|nr:hypothetical protein TNCV_2377251 [Trichonephila clavipes]
MSTMSDGSINFEPRSSSKNGTSLSKLPHHANGNTDPRHISRSSPPHYGGSLVVLESSLITHWSRVQNHKPLGYSGHMEDLKEGRILRRYFEN